MCHRYGWVLGAWIFSAAPAAAQQTPAVPPVIQTIEWKDPGNPTTPGTVSKLPDVPSLPPLPVNLTANSGVDCRGNCADNFRFWARVDYLLWWLKDGPLPTPLVTVGDPGDAVPGAIGQPGTQVLLGGSNIHFRTACGIRLALGGWFDAYHNLGVEANFFSLERLIRRFHASSDDDGDPVLAFPFFSRTPGAKGETALPISSSDSLAGDVRVTSAIELCGAEVNGVFCLWREPGLEYTLLAGLRYASLEESIYISNTTYSLGGGPNTVGFLTDSFCTRNQFFGAQVGGKVHWEGERFFLDVVGKLALGSTRQVVDIRGDATFYSGGFNYYTGGLYTQPSNIGRYTADQVTIIPSLELKVGYQISARWRAFLGYDFLYWNSVVRPGNQIDRNINYSQSTSLGGSGTLSGPVAPATLFQRSDFWAQGLNLGVELRF